MILFNKFITFSNTTECWQLLLIGDHFHNNKLLYLIIINKILFKLFIFLKKNQKSKNIINGGGIKNLNIIFGSLISLIFFSEFLRDVNCSEKNKNNNLSPLVSPPFFFNFDENFNLPLNQNNNLLPLASPPFFFNFDENFNLSLNQNNNLSPLASPPFFSNFDNIFNNNNINIIDNILGNNENNILNSIVDYNLNNSLNIDIINEFLKDKKNHEKNLLLVLNIDFHTFFNENKNEIFSGNYVFKTQTDQTIKETISCYFILNEKAININNYVKNNKNILKIIKKEIPLKNKKNIKSSENYDILKKFYNKLIELNKDFIFEKSELLKKQKIITGQKIGSFFNDELAVFRYIKQDCTKIINKINKKK